MEKLRILAVDDNSISLAAIEQELKKEYEVIPVNSGSRALQYLRREKPDLILLDIQMAQKDGIETLREIREMEKCKDIPVIMLTSKQDKSAVVETSKLGIYDYVLKPFKGEDLHQRINRVLRNCRKIIGRKKRWQYSMMYRQWNSFGCLAATSQPAGRCGR